MQTYALPLPQLLLITLISCGYASNRSVSWWLADYNSAALAENVAFLNDADGSVSAIFHCCAGPRIAANGSYVPNALQEAMFSELVRAERGAGNGLTSKRPILLSLSPAPDAVLDGVAQNAVPALVALASRIGCDGFVADYEPHANTTEAHATLYAAFLGTLGAALHRTGKRLAVCVSDWGVLNQYGILSTAQADWYVSMSNTYGGRGAEYTLAAKLGVKRMLEAFPVESVIVGIGTVAPASCHCTFGDTGNCTADYGWTQQSLSAFVRWSADRGVRGLAVWRTDIYPRYCNTSDGSPPGISSFMLPVFDAFMNAGKGTVQTLTDSSF